MSSIRGFRCQRCRAEVLAAAEAPGLAARPDWTPPVLCCGELLHPLETDQMLAEILGGVLARGRTARCPRCGYRVRMVVHPAGPLVCMICQMDFEFGAREAALRDEAAATVAVGDRGAQASAP